MFTLQAAVAAGVPLNPAVPAAPGQAHSAGLPAGILRRLPVIVFDRAAGEWGRGEGCDRGVQGWQSSTFLPVPDVSPVCSHSRKYSPYASLCIWNCLILSETF